MTLIPEQEQFPQTEEELLRRLKFFDIDIKHCTIHPDLSVSVSYPVELNNEGFTYLPIKFNIIEGNFSCHNNKLITLRGAPQEVSGSFICSSNELTSLEYAPQIVGKVFNCQYNKITTLKFKHRAIHIFYCPNNQLTEIDMIPNGVSLFHCTDNYISSFSQDCVIDQSSKMKTMNLANNKFTSCKTIPEIPNLKQLGLENNQISFFENNIGEEIISLSLENNPLTDFNSNKLPKLKNLFLRNTQLSGNYQSLSKLPPSCNIRLDYKKMKIDDKIEICHHSWGSLYRIMSDISLKKETDMFLQEKQQECLMFLKKKKIILNSL